MVVRDRMAPQYALVSSILVCAVSWTSLLVITSGCGAENCTAIYVTPRYLISVRDADTQVPICDAVVHVWQVSATRVDCKYSADIPLSFNTAQIGVSRTGYKPLTTDVSTQYDTDSCGNALPKSIVLDLERL